MSGSQIDAEEEFVHKLYGEDYLYQIPKFQRPFSWTEENFVDLVDDLTDAYESNSQSHGDLLNRDQKLDKSRTKAYEPYFLGSIILNRGGSTGDRFDVIDGQQRLTSVAILLCVLRDRLDHEGWSTSLDRFVQEEEDFAKGQEGSVRLRIRDRDQAFFEENVLERGATLDPADPADGDTEPQQNILQAVSTFDERLEQWADRGNDLTSLAAFIPQRVVMVRIMTDSLSSAFRLFNVTNARGMPLNNADLLKSENLSQIPEAHRDEYQRKWEDMEEEVGNEGLERFIGYMRHILVKNKSQKSIYDEFSDVFTKKPTYRGRDFVDELEQVFDVHRKRVYDAKLDADDEHKNVYYANLVSVMRDFYPSDEWVVALIEFDKTFDDEGLLYDFVCRLERRLTVDWLTGSSSSDRYSRVYSILKTIESADGPREVLRSDYLTGDLRAEKEDFEESLDLRNFYRKGNYQWPKYILMRLNLERYDNRNVKVQYGNNINVEHILPQNPSSGYWTQRFSDELEREKWTNRLGNLVLLDGRKNYKASNRPFPRKYREYFEKKSDFAITNELSEFDSWTPSLLKERHENLIDECLGLWVDSAAETETNVV
ncbi:hypothetical protein C457_11231 [Haloferax prahovense DSM 18310]|uniref:DUF262 domain-containing protein n=1 Tax=Haloferax prahovense (strain DSM 18310 / JCM 13924 / TL6) TaxID=1227461 RepID=M0GAL5_HALPT|nr:DUF262 domain-containing protein [Haloferax prahovense]ELZ68573.1 hypothetical protein C457_11231 [Haloferax prahovense DSM 18310]